jgi:hypothetical protein
VPMEAPHHAIAIAAGSLALDGVAPVEDDGSDHYDYDYFVGPFEYAVPFDY